MFLTEVTSVRRKVVILLKFGNPTVCRLPIWLTKITIKATSMISQRKNTFKTFLCYAVTDQTVIRHDWRQQYFASSVAFLSLKFLLIEIENMTQFLDLSSKYSLHAVTIKAHPCATIRKKKGTNLYRSVLELHVRGIP